jgi:hypothetical protein
VSVPSGFLELNPAPGALGPFEARRAPYGIAGAEYPVFARFRLYWGTPGAAAGKAADWPALVLYGGPVPYGWASQNLPALVAAWAATLGPRSGGAPGERWIVAASAPAYLVPPEALSYPWTSFRWVWQEEGQKPDVYQIEGVATLPQFRNLRTGKWDRPGPFGNMPDAIAGCTCTKDKATADIAKLIDSDEVDPRAINWLTSDLWESEGRWGPWPPWVVDDYDVGAEQVAAEADPNYRYFHLGGPAGRFQCPATTVIAGVPAECSLVYGHPGPHQNAWAELGRVWEGDLIGAVAKKDWYRLYFVDVVTGNDAYSPYQQMTASQAKAWRNRRQTRRSPVLAILQVFKSGIGWRSA